MKKMLGVAFVAASVVAGALVGYKAATDAEFRGRLTRGAQDLYTSTKEHVDTVTEDVALKTAQVTKNPKVNQDWVANQWESLGY